jgi:hypothetical protein
VVIDHVGGGCAAEAAHERNLRNGGGAGDAREFLEAGEEGGGGRVDAEVVDLIQIVAGGNGVEPLDVADEDAGEDEEYEAGGDLAAEEQIP